MIALRIKQPDRQRPWTGPGSIKVTGHQLPVYSVVGGIGTGIAFIVVNVLNVTTLIAGSIWLVVGVVSYVLYRRNQGLSLTQTTKVVMPKPIVEHEVEYPEAVNTAIKLAAPGRRAIHVLVTITVPASAPVDAAMLEAEATRQAAIDSARLSGKRRVSGHVEKVRAGEAGRRIVLEAREIKAAAVVMALPPRRTGSSVFGRTLETVLFQRPCRVIIDSSRDVQERAPAT